MQQAALKQCYNQCTVVAIGASSGSVVSILCAIGVAIVGAATGYFAYQRKKLCFKNSGGEIPSTT